MNSSFSLLAQVGYLPLMVIAFTLIVALVAVLYIHSHRHDLNESFSVWDALSLPGLGLVQVSLCRVDLNIDNAPRRIKSAGYHLINKRAVVRVLEEMIKPPNCDLFFILYDNENGGTSLYPSIEKINGFTTAEIERAPKYVAMIKDVSPTKPVPQSVAV